MSHICCRTRQEEEHRASVKIDQLLKTSDYKESRIDRHHLAIIKKQRLATCCSRQERSSGLSSILQKQHELIVTTNELPRSQRCSDI